MKAIKMLLLLAGIFLMMLGVQYDEREGERRDQLPLGWFGGVFFRGVAAQDIGTRYDRCFAAPDTASITQTSVNHTQADDYFKTAGDNIYAVPGSLDFCPIDSFDEFKHIIEDKLSGIKEGVEHDIEAIESAASKIIDHAYSFRKSVLAYLVRIVTFGLYSVEELEAIVTADPCETHHDDDPDFVPIIEALGDFIVEYVIELKTGIHNSFASLHYWVITQSTDFIYLSFMSAGLTVMAAPGLVSGPVLGVIAWGMPKFVSEWLTAMIMHMFDEEVAVGIIRLCESAMTGGPGLEAFNYLIKTSGLAAVLLAFAGLVADLTNK
ncbi:hypothetical protein GCG54_00009988 [Colletotrichum gloeosporioides]|uniref:Integral membrane protein n=1 Tax=Colletotrichum gloeosporioides TaxID=474922 RepID=A0A8H4C9S1_COLGL|nr:uncharacterized protein GCG54_00009988 [Colletotrichum gloeosporioides]KAF3799799.1 hypothetical protein GCG54_00009988 [Colletotrichum gloeosporioides]